MLSDPCDKPYFPYRISVGYGEHPPLVCWNLQDVPLKTSRPGTLTVLEIAVEDGEILSEKSSTADSKPSEPLICRFYSLNEMLRYSLL